MGRSAPFSAIVTRFPILKMGNFALDSASRIHHLGHLNGYCSTRTTMQITRWLDLYFSLSPLQYRASIVEGVATNNGSLLLWHLFSWHCCVCHFSECFTHTVILHLFLYIFGIFIYIQYPGDGEDAGYHIHLNPSLIVFYKEILNSQMAPDAHSLSYYMSDEG